MFQRRRAARTMPRFFFAIESEPDTIGLDLPDRRAARGEAIKAAGEILRDIDGAFSGEPWTMTVTGESGEFVLELRFSILEGDGA